MRLLQGQHSGAEPQPAAAHACRQIPSRARSPQCMCRQAALTWCVRAARNANSWNPCSAACRLGSSVASALRGKLLLGRRQAFHHSAAGQHLQPVRGSVMHPPARGILGGDETHGPGVTELGLPLPTTLPRPGLCASAGLMGCSVRDVAAGWCRGLCHGQDVPVVEFEHTAVFDQQPRETLPPSPPTATCTQMQVSWMQPIEQVSILPSPHHVVRPKRWSAVPQQCSQLTQ